MKEYLKTINARIEHADKCAELDFVGMACEAYKNIINDLIDMVKTLDTHIEAMKEIIKGE